MKNWKRTKKELPNELDIVAFKLYDVPFIGIANYSENAFWEDDGFSDTPISPSEVEAWCKVPEFDLED